MDRARRTFVDRMGVVAEADGLSPIEGRLFGYLLLADEPESLDDLAAALQVSKASVSTDARRLVDRGIVRRALRPGDRKDYYELAPDFYADLVRNRVRRWAALQALATELRGEAADLAPAVKQRLAAMTEVSALVIARVNEALAEWDRQSHARGARSASGGRRQQA